MPQFIEHCERKALKPECISAAAQRANARAFACEGHARGCRSARYSVIASESQTVVSPSTRHGTLPFGEKSRNAPQFEPGANGTSFSSNGMSSSRIRIHGRNDHDE